MSTDREQSDADQVSNNDKLDRLIESSRDVTASNKALALAMVEYQERARLARVRFRWTNAVVLIAAFIVIEVQFHTSAEGRAQIADCVVPGGHCYQRSQDSTKAAVGAIVQSEQQIAARAAACAPEYVTLPPIARTRAIYECIVRSHQ